MGALIPEMACMNIDMRPMLYEQVTVQPYKFGIVYASHSDGALHLDGTAHGRPLHLVLPILERRKGELRRRKAACPGCARGVYRLHIFPDGSIGCRLCRTWARKSAVRQAREYRAHPDRLTRALESGTAREKHWALQALTLGPVRGKRPTRFPSRRILRGEYEPWPEELLQLRLLWTGYFPWE